MVATDSKNCHLCCQKTAKQPPVFVAAESGVKCPPTRIYLMTDKKKKYGLFSKIESRDDSLKTIKDASMGFFFIAALQGVLGDFFAPSMIIDGVMYAVLAGALIYWKSRVATVLLLLLGGSALVMTVLNRLGVTAEGGNNIILGVIVAWVAIRAVEATFKLHGKYAAEGT